MAQTSLLHGKHFYCREWMFHKLQHCLQEKNICCSSSGVDPSPGSLSGNNATTAPSGKGAGWGVLLVGGPGSGKTALITELLWPSSPAGFHFCRAQDSDTLCLGGFIRGLVAQISKSGLMSGYEEKLKDPAVQSLLQPGECERNASEAFKRCSMAFLL